MAPFLTDRASHCAVCMAGAVDGRRFVDMNSSIDGPALYYVASDTAAVVDIANGVPTASIEDNIICESCLQSAVELLELKAETRDRMQRRIDHLKKQVSAMQRYADTLERSLGEKPPELPILQPVA